MKKLFYIAALAILASCSQDQPADYEPLKDSSKENKIRTVEEAKCIANDIISNTVKSRSNSPTISTVHAITSTQSRSTNPDTLIYALDIEDNGGFILIAAPKNVEPILAVIDEGSYTDPQNIENEAYQMTLSQLTQCVLEQKDAIPSETPILPLDTRLELMPYEYWDTITTIQIFFEGRVKVAWNQRWPENIYAPNKIAGCAPVAIAQALSYLEYPKSITYTFPNRDLNSEELNWTEIKKHRQSVNGYSQNCVNCSAASETHNTIGRLVREIGHIANSNYKPTSTGTRRDSTVIALNYFTGKTHYRQRGLMSTLFDKLKDNGGISLVMCDGTTSTQKPAGHGWLVDNTNLCTMEITHYVYNGDTKSYDIVDEKYEETKLLHYNWGWGGNCNGYFNVSIFDSGKGSKYDYKDLPNPTNFILDPDSFEFILIK